MSNNSSASDTCFSADRLRAVAWEQWILTLSKIEQVDSGIVRLAEAEAHRQYKEMRQGLDNVVLDAWPIEITGRWATWQALNHACVNEQMGLSLLTDVDCFSAEVEKFIREQFALTDQSGL